MSELGSKADLKPRMFDVRSSLDTVAKLPEGHAINFPEIEMIIRSPPYGPENLCWSMQKDFCNSIPSTADIHQGEGKVSFVPISDLCIVAIGTLFNRVVGVRAGSGGR
jgi:hypothetical protein